VNSQDSKKIGQRIFSPGRVDRCMIGLVELLELNCSSRRVRRTRRRKQNS